MKFHVGSFAYQLIIADRRVYDEAGAELEGRALESLRLIIISCIVERERRREVLRHELEHCWQFHVPRAEDDESRCQLAALIDDSFDKDLEQQGGNTALRTLEAQSVPALGKPKANREILSGVSEVYGRPDAKVCSACDATVLCGSIETSDPFLHEGTNRTRVQRWMTCEACGTLTHWQEFASADGGLTGELVPNPPPRMLQGATARQWLAMKLASAVGSH